MRLRGEVGALKRQLAANAAPQTLPQDQQIDTSDVTDSQKEEERITQVKMNFTKMSMMALINHAQQNQGRFPANLYTAEPLLADEARNQNIATNQFELVFQGSMNELTNPANAIVVREREAHQTPSGSWKKVYGLADGHTQAYETQDDNFQTWEQEHMAP